VHISKAILLNLILVIAVVALGVSVCSTRGIAAHTSDAALAAAIGLIAVAVGLLPIHFRRDRTPVTMFQSAWIGSILHMGLALALGVGGICFFKLSTPFVLWLLAIYWITLIGLCVALVKTLRTIGPTQQITFG
jgi:hypothetical protein